MVNIDIKGTTAWPDSTASDFSCPDAKKPKHKRSNNAADIEISFGANNIDNNTLIEYAFPEAGGIAGLDF